MDRIASPRTEVFKLFVTGREDHLQKFPVAAWTTNIFWRAAALTGNADRLGSRITRWQALLQHNLMRPRIPEIVKIAQGVAFHLEHVADRHRVLIKQFEIAEFIVFGYAPTTAVLLELVKVTIGPAHHNLQGAVKAAQFQRTRYLKP